ncbi:MAG: heme-binding domain-containing protein [Bacteroidales bacterium]
MNKKILALLIIGLIFLVLQFIPSGIPENNPVAGQGIFEVAQVPGDVQAILEKACFDCHSQQVTFPWYSYVAPASWLVARDVNVGRANLDFGKWGELSKRKQLQLLDEINDEVSSGTMPMVIYTFMHSEAKLTQEERESIVNWAEQFAEQVLEN